MEEIWLHTAHRWSIEQADSYVDKIAETFDLLVDNPRMGRERSDMNKPMRTIPVASHIILYRIEPDQNITIIRIRHASEDWLNAQ